MKRFIGGLTFLMVLGAVVGVPAQETTHRTLADRIGSLREGWSFSTDEPVEPKQPAAEEPPVRVASRPQASVAVSDSPRPFPRVNPRELMPRSWFGVGVKDLEKPSASPAVTEPVPPSTGGAVGSARARLLRDMRGPVAAPATQKLDPVTTGAVARAGSVLSPGADPTSSATESSVAAANAQLARSIAAEVAGVMVVAESEEQQATPSAVEDSFAADEVEHVAESVLPFDAIEGETPTDEPAVEAVADSTPAEVPPQPSLPAADDAPIAVEGDGGRISVAARPQETTKLPLFIGGRYSQYDDETETTVTSTPESKPAADAFATGPASAKAPASESTLPFGGTPAVAAAVEEDDLLFTQRMPVLVSKVSGPRTIVVGREATYRVLLANRGEVGANQVVTKITIPDWAEVVGVKAADGSADRQVNTDGDLMWRTDRLGAGQVAKLDLRLIARAGRPIELAVAHTHAPIDGLATVEVQEPKLALAMVGPEEVLFGKPQLFRLTLSNPGTGAAEKVVLHLTPPGGDLEKRTSHDFGVIPAGEERTVEIELTAREAGKLAVTASAEADGDVSAQTIKEVFCRKPELIVDWRGPSERYAGAPAVYYFRVRNPGTATAPGVVLTAELPSGFDILPAPNAPPVADGKIVYRVGDLVAGGDKYFELRGVMRTAGANTISLRAVDTGETRSERVAALTEVIALADLKLDVSDPKGPIATGQEIAYGIRVTNRGSNDARDVRVIGLFSDGIEPHHVEGGASDIHDGRVAFETIDRMAAGETREFTIHARAHEEGTHLFRAEVLCRDLEIKLAAEETTRFFEDEAIDVAGEGYPSGSLNSLYPR